MNGHVQDLFDFAASLAERDAALAQVKDNAGDWFSLALAIVPACRAELADTFLGEDLRAAIMSRIGPPHSPNAWGVLIRNAVARGYIAPTGQFAPMKAKTSHARMTPVYR